MGLDNTGWLMPQDGSGEDDDLLTQFLKSKRGGTLPPNLYSNKSDTTNTNANKTGTKTIVSRSIYPDANDIQNQQAQLNFLRTQPEFQGQQEGIKNFEDALSMVKNVPARDDSWVKPLVAMASAESGKDLMEGYEQNAMNSKDKYNQILKYQDEISKRKAEQGKELLQGLAASKVGTSLTALTAENALTDKNSNQDVLGVKPVKAGGGAKSKFYDKYNTDLGADAAKFEAAGGYEGVKANIAKLDKALGIIDGWAASDKNSGWAGKLGSQILHAGQSAIGRGSDAAEASRLINSVSSSGLKDQFGSRITNIEITQALKNADDSTLPPEQRASELRDIRDKIVNTGSQLQDATNYARQHGGIDANYRSNLSNTNFGANQNPGGGKPASIKQNGHTYILNPKTGQYE